MSITKHLTFLALALALTAVVFVSPAMSQGLKADEIISKHLESIGPANKRAALTTVMALGYSEFEARNPQVKGGGKAVVVSNAENLFFIISLNSREYPFEKIGYFSGKPSLPFINAGTRSLLGVFLAEHAKLLSDGFFGGVLTLRWPFSTAEQGKTGFKSGGTKKVNDRKAYVLEHISAGGSDEFSIKLFFDAETFRHIRSEYRREVVRGQGIFGQQNQQANAVITLSEDFSDFRTIGDLTLPFSHEIKFVSNSNTTSNENIWRVKVAEYRLNQKLQPDFFTFDPK